MNRGDIKLVIDQLDQVDIENHDDYVISNAVALIEGLGNKVAEQAAVIETKDKALREALYWMPLERRVGGVDNWRMVPNGEAILKTRALVEEAIDIPTDSKQILADWMREQLGEPVYYEYRAWFAENTVTPGWGEWERVKPRDALCTIDDAVNELQQYIDSGYKYQLRELHKLPECLK